MTERSEEMPPVPTQVTPAQRPLRGLRRRIYLTYKYHGLRSVAYRAATFPLRFTPFGRLVQVSRTARSHQILMTNWYRKHGHSVMVVIPSYRDADQVRTLVTSIRRTTRKDMVRIVVADDASGPEHLAALKKIRGVEVVEGEKNLGFAANVNRGIRARREDEDVIVLNSDVVALRGWLPALQYAANRYPTVGIVTGKLLYGDDRIQFGGTVRNLGAPEWFDHRFRFKPATWGPANVSQQVLAATGACMYIKRSVLEHVGLLDESYPMAYEDVDYCLRAWQAGYAVLYWPHAELRHLESVTRGTEVGQRERTSQRVFWRRWGDFFDARNVRDAEGRLRIIYVTEDTGVGGGHRVVFEHINHLVERGHQVELWSLGGPPTWFELNAPVRTFADYVELAEALTPVEGIKVATWWATVAPVWQASVTRGIPVYFVQDIETSYYPDSELLRNEVLASYRQEFRYMTTSSWNYQQLEEMGITATLVPPAVDLLTFKHDPAPDRRADMVLGLGRSNPLKNLPLTLSAWKTLTEPRPELCLFGIEPELVEGIPGIRYVERPSDPEINELLNEATVFVQTSSHEGFCLPILEAMAAGCPVVCTDAHGNRDFCRDGVNCLMPEPDRASVAEALRRVLQDAELQERLSAAGVQTASRYSWSETVTALEHFFEEVARPRRIAPTTNAVPDLKRAPAR